MRGWGARLWLGRRNNIPTILSHGALVVSITSLPTRSRKSMRTALEDRMHHLEYWSRDRFCVTAEDSLFWLYLSSEICLPRWGRWPCGSNLRATTIIARLDYHSWDLTNLIEEISDMEHGMKKCSGTNTWDSMTFCATSRDFTSYAVREY